MGALVAATVLEVTADGVGAAVGALLGVGLGAVVGAIDGGGVAGMEEVVPRVAFGTALVQAPITRASVASTTSILRIDRS